MKQFNLLPVAVALVLMVTAVSCTTVRETNDDEYYERTSSTPNRIYVDDPYRGTVVLERDPVTGRYYEVNSYGNNYGNRNRIYNESYGGRRDNVYSRDRRIYRSPQQNTPQQPTQEQIKEREKVKEEARKKVLGN